MIDRNSRWRRAVDFWFKLFATIALGYLILAQIVRILQQFADISTILVGGVLIAYFAFPPVSWLNKRLPLWASLLIVYASYAGLIAVAFYFLVPTAVGQIQGLIASLPQLEHGVEHALRNPHSSFLSRLPPALQQYIQKLPSQIGHSIQGNVAAYSSRLFNTLFLLVGVGVVAVATPVVSIYMLAESPLIKRFFLRAFPRERQQATISFLSDVDEVIGGFIRGQIIVAAVVGCLAIIALLVLHVPYALVIGVWAGVADVIPYIGPFAGAIPAAIIASIYNGPASLIGVIAAFVAINQLEGHLLGPRIVSSTVKITPLAVIFALLIGGKLFGFVGLIIAVPLAGVIRVILMHIFPDREISNVELQPGLSHPAKANLDPHATDA